MRSRLVFALDSLSTSVCSTRRMTVASRTVAKVTRPCAVWTGVTAMSIGASVPSARRAVKANPDPRRRSLGSSVNGAVPCVSVPKPRREEDFEGLADQLAWPPAQEGFTLPVGEDDLARTVDRQHRVGCGLGQFPVQVAVPKPVLLVEVRLVHRHRDVALISIESRALSPT
jgi:hypothetical protein